MEDEIPTYLVSVAVAPYVLNESTHKNIPVVLASEAKDSLNMALSFVHLPNAIDAYLKGYGPHSFNRIGFNAVPFNGGAMEHATNIAYPQGTLDGKTTSETLFAHELAHHWWGNTVTCRTAEDMWINEGWARYSESLFLEETYGNETYRDAISDLHKSVLHSAHLRDRDTLPISGIGHTNTYGAHVYDKGAVVVHTLRGYMGSDAFFEACREFMKEFKFQDVSSDDLKTHFQKYTPKDLDAFFDDWVYQKGFPHFDILEWTRSAKNDSFLVKVRIRQQLKFADNFYKNVPMELFVIGEDRQSFTTELSLSGPDDLYQFMSAFDPKFMALDPNEKISDAVTDRMKYLSRKDTFSMGDAMMDIIVRELKDSALVHVAHHWISPDQWYRNETFPVMSKERYWSVDGQWAETDRMDAIIEYNGRRSGANYAIGYLDVQLIGITEDSLRLFYRPHPTAYWEEYPDYSLETGSKFDRKGIIKIRNLQKGEYTLAMADYGLLSSPDLVEKQLTSNLKIYPVPASEKLQLECPDAAGSILEILNSEGRVIYSDTIVTTDWKSELDISNWSNGVYYAGIITKGKAYQPKAFVVRR
jgi:aminopeptidase N